MVINGDHHCVESKFVVVNALSKKSPAIETNETEKGRLDGHSVSIRTATVPPFALLVRYHRSLYLNLANLYL